MWLIMSRNSQGEKLNEDLEKDFFSKETISSKTDLPLKSINGRRCLTKCYPKGATYLHPVLLTGVIDNIANSCAIEPVHSKDPQYYREYEMIFADKCKLEDNKVFKPPDEIDSFLLSFYFNPRDFLDSIYGLHSFDEVIYWTISYDYLPFDTIKRVHNSAWKVFGNKIEELSNTVLEYYYDIAKEYWLRDYIKLIENNYSFNLVADTPSPKIGNASDAMYQIINSKFFTYNFFVNAVKRFVYEYEDQWETIDSHYGMLKKFVFEKLVEQMDKESRQKVS